MQDRHRPELSISRFQASLWEDLTDLGVAIGQSARWEQAVRGLIGGSTIDHAETPETLKAKLRPYQLDGYRWLRFLWAHQLGGILADDMGLGKTLQALALICHARLVCPEQPPFLVVAPTSVVSNWSSEAARFAPDLRVVCLTESESKRGAPSAEAVAAADLVITSYSLLRIDNDRLTELDWSGLLLDEAQFVKNHRAKTYQCARRIVAPFKLAITGTPLENSLMDLWALFSITAPGLFPDPDRFSEYYRRPIERNMDAIRLRQLRRRIRPLMLRRTKESVASEPPPKQEQVVEVELHPRHRRIYQTHSATRTAESPRSDRRSRSQPIHGAQVADLVASTQPRPGAARRCSQHRAGGKGRGAAGRSERVGRRRPSSTGLQPIHDVLDQNPEATGGVRHLVRVPRWADSEPRTRNPAVPGQGRIGLFDQPEGRRLRAQSRRG